MARTLSLHSKGGPKVKPMSVRFWRFVTKGTPGQCWLWVGGGARYGRIGTGMRDGRHQTIASHRASWEIHNGPVPDGLFVLHRCDVPRCVNPAHLFLGTQAENMADMDAKGRRAPVSVRTRTGARNPNSRLTDADVVAIRASLGVRQRDLAKQYGVSQGVVWCVINRRTWKHVA